MAFLGQVYRGICMIHETRRMGTYILLLFVNHKKTIASGLCYGKQIDRVRVPYSLERVGH